MLQEIIQGILAQSRLSISQAISLIESNPKEGIKLLSDLYEHTGRAYCIGITGPPGFDIPENNPDQLQLHF